VKLLVLLVWLSSSFYLCANALYYWTCIQCVASDANSSNSHSDSVYFIIGIFQSLIDFLFGACLLLVCGLICVLYFLGRRSPYRSTGKSDPVPTSEFEVDPLEGHDSIVMSIAPGRKKGRTCYRDLATDLSMLKSVHQVDVIVTLLTAEDMEDILAPRMLHDIVDHGMESVHFPIRDKWIPFSMLQMASVVQEIHQKVSQGKRVLIHCNGGKGRTGTVVCAYLVQHAHMSVSEAIQLIRKSRPGTLKNPLQIAYMHFFRYRLRNGLQLHRQHQAIDSPSSDQEASLKT